MCMIFRRLYRRRMLRQFGPFMDAAGLAALEKMGAEISEWRAFKALLPLKLVHSRDEVDAALSEVSRLARHYSRNDDGGT